MPPLTIWVKNFDASQHRDLMFCTSCEVREPTEKQCLGYYINVSVNYQFTNLMSAAGEDHLYGDIGVEVPFRLP
jgi:hypothetical protein